MFIKTFPSSIPLLVLACLALNSSTGQETKAEHREKRDLASDFVDKFADNDTQKEEIKDSIESVQGIANAFDSTEEPSYDYGGSFMAQSSYSLVFLLNLIAALLAHKFVIGFIFAELF